MHCGTQSYCICNWYVAKQIRSRYYWFFRMSLSLALFYLQIFWFIYLLKSPLNEFVNLFHCLLHFTIYRYSCIVLFYMIIFLFVKYRDEFYKNHSQTKKFMLLLFLSLLRCLLYYVSIVFKTFASAVFPSPFISIFGSSDMRTKEENNFGYIKYI